MSDVSMPWLTARGWRGALIALSGGAVSALALPPIHAVPLLALTIPALLLQIDRAATETLGEDHATRRRWATVFRLGLCFGMGFNTAGLYWLTNAILVRADQFWWLVPLAAPLAALPLALAMAVPCLAVAAVPPRVAGPDRLARALVFAGTWVLVDIVRSVLFTGFPWNLLGSVWEFPGYAGDVMIQPAAWIGIDGLTLLTVLLAALPLLGARGGIAILLIVAIWVGAGVTRLTADRPALAQAPVAVLAQGNIDENEKLDRAAMVGIFRRYLALTAAGMAQVRDRGEAGRAVVVAWPETAFPGLLVADVQAREMIAQAAKGARAMMIGSVRYGDDGRPRNSVIALDPDGDVTARYDKAHLVPFGEYQPRGLPIQIVPHGGFAAGPGRRTLALFGLPAVGPLICYEVIFPGDVTEPGHRPAWLLNVTNDAWYGDSTGPRQHLAASRMRAVEEGLPLARDANTGISAMFDAYGHELARLGWGAEGNLIAPIGPALPPTPFARFGTRIPLALALLTIALGLVRLGRNRSARNPGLIDPAAR